MKTTRQSVKVAELRKTYGQEMNLERWCEDPNNVLCTRNGRVFIHEADPKDATKKVKRIFVYAKSKWHNPFKVGQDGDLKTVCDKFKNHILTSDLRNDLHELEGKTLGCFCAPKDQCHTDTLIELFERRDNLPEPVEIVEVQKVPTPKTSGTKSNDDRVKCKAKTKTNKNCSRWAKVDGYCNQHHSMYGSD